MSFTVGPRPIRVATTALLFAVLVTVPPAAMGALDLTGTWEGTWKCKDVTSNAANNIPTGTLTMTVTQSGDDVYAFIAWDGYGSETFQGHVQELTDKPGQGASTLIACPTRAGSDAYGETLSAKLKVDQTDPLNATFKGKSAYEAVPAVGGTCKYSLKRTATTDPLVAACPNVPQGRRIQTGQTTCWNTAGSVVTCAGTGHDGELQKGLAAAYTDNGDGTITDENTGLMWEKLSDDGSIHDKDTAYTWDNAFAVKVATLNSGTFAGYTDWRVPNVNELQSIVNYQNVSPSLSPAFNTGCAPACTVTTCSCTVSSYYWSSSTYANNPIYAWRVYFFDGLVFANFNKTNVSFVRAVRGGS